MTDLYLKLTEGEAELLEAIMRIEKKEIRGQGTLPEEQIFNIYRKLKEELIKSDLERRVDSAIEK